MFLVRLFFILLMSLFFSACGRQPYVKQESAYIIVKTPAMRYADMGFVYENPNEVKVEIYSSGQPVLALRITPENVCRSTLACMSKRAFNAQMLSPAYPTDTIERIFRAQPIFSGENIDKKRNGFTQKLTKNGVYDIDYSVLKNETVFRDTINHIMIKIKRLRG